MSRYIDADELIEYAEKRKFQGVPVDVIKSKATAEVEEVRYGQYENTTSNITLLTQECSICKERGAIGNYCMWCGAKMSGGKE